MRIVYMGTPEFAVPCLEMLVSEGHQVLAVVCQPDKPKGRKMQIAMPPVKEAAIKLGVEKILQPEKARDKGFINQISDLNPELLVTCAYGKILPKALLDIPVYGCINVHASLLPKYRGAGPIQWCIINGEKETGITTMLTDVGMDTGDMLLKTTVQIDENMDAGELHDALMFAGADLLKETIIQLEAGALKRIPQDHIQATHAPMLTKEIGVIDWSKTAVEIHNLVRGTTPWPGAFATLNGERLKICKTRVSSLLGGQPGSLVNAEGQRFIVACGNGSLEILEIQPQSGKRMDARSFINGRRLTGNEQFDVK